MKIFAIINLLVSLAFTIGYFASVNHGKEVLIVRIERVSRKNLREHGLLRSEITSLLQLLMEIMAQKLDWQQ